MNSPESPGGAPGRPRDARRDAAILDAALELLAEAGYDRLSVEAVATRAGVARTTVYRRYRDKAELVAAAVEQRSGGVPPSPRSGSLRGDVRATVGWLAEEISAQEVGLLGTLFAGMRGDPALAAAMRRILRRDGSAMADGPLAGAAERGEALAPRAAALFAEVAPAVIVHRIVFAGERCDPAFLDHLVDDILLPLMRGAEHSRRDTEGAES